MSTTGNRPPHQNQNSSNNDLNVDVPDEAPPAYELVSGDQTIQSGPQRMDFSGPPPLPDRFQAPAGAPPPQHLSQTPTGGQNIPGVGFGYGGSSGGHGTGQWAPPPSHPATAAYRPPPGPPQNSFSPPPASPSSSAPPPPPPNRPGSSTSVSSVQDTTPTEAPVPGRPLLNKGQLLVYPKGYWCGKCNNTGYKQGDPSRPCNSDWKKYGKDFSGALAHSYSIAPKPGANGTTSAATNFQRPLPQRNAAPPPPPPMSSPRPPPPPPQHYGGYGGGYGGWQPPFRPAYGPPPGALVLQPGDPRIGGRLCQRCGGSGTEIFFLFDDGPCRQCQGVGRVF